MVGPLARYRPYLVLTVLFIVLLAATIYALRRPEPVVMVITTPTPRPSFTPQPTPTPAQIQVDVRGAIARPGVYTLASGSRVQDVLVLAGNLLSNAEIRNLNLARKLVDGELIYIPMLGEATATAAATPSKGERPPTPTKTPIGKININTATVEELDVLPGIGPGIAQRIIEYRTQKGPFKKIEDLKEVRGIGDAVFSQIKDYITVQ